MTLPRQGIIMPLAPQDMVKDLASRYRFSLKILAKTLNTTPRTLYRVQKGGKASCHLLSAMIRLYCVLAQ
jgi:hypothetical protein